MRWIVPTCVAAVALGVAPGTAFASRPAPVAGNLSPGMEEITTCGASLFSPYTMSGFGESLYCPPGTNIPPGMALYEQQNVRVPAGQRASWRADAPAGLTIVAAAVPNGDLYTNLINDGHSWGGGFYWQNGSASIGDNTPGWSALMSSSFLGFQIVCGWSTCNGHVNPTQFTVESINLYARETQGPSLVSPSGLWDTSGWVRGGGWSVPAWGDSPSGLCSISATLNGQPIPGGSSGSSVDTTRWHQCGAGPINPTVSTALFGQGALPLTLQATDAAGLTQPYTKNVYVDNTTPTVSLSGPTEASAGGTQYVTASASAGPSGVSGIWCSVDGSQAQRYQPPSAQVAVAGLGSHTVRCTAANNARDVAGNVAVSAPARWSLALRGTTVGAISFAKLVDALRCHRVTERVRVAGRWVVVHHHGKLRRVWRGAHVKLATLTRCHARTVIRRVTSWVTIVRHGRRVRVKRTRMVRVLLLPHLVSKSSERIAYGHGATVAGWLGTGGLQALGGRPVEILTAADNGLGDFSTAARTATNVAGFWAVKLPPGPSRLIEAYFPGDGLDQPSVTPVVRLAVPARVRLISVWPRRIAWSTPGHPASVRIVGQLEGGYLPPTGTLVRLRIGVGSRYTTYGVQTHVSGDGRFTTTYTFGYGDPSFRQAYWFQIATLPVGDYPYAPAASRRLTVNVGGNPTSGGNPTGHHRRTHHHHRKR